jgi:hypothetical protein
MAPSNMELFFKENKKIIFKVQKMETKIHDVHNKETTSV